jgi:hypothetical protein
VGRKHIAESLEIQVPQFAKKTCYLIMNDIKR